MSASNSKILVLNGPNLNRLDLRDTNTYGSMNWEQLVTFINSCAKELGLEVEVKQSNSETEIIEWLQGAAQSHTPVIINPAAFTHYSYAIRDAVELIKAPVIEVHLSNPMAREEFRHTSVVSGVANGTIAGFGPNSYHLALIAMSKLLSK